MNISENPLFDLQKTLYSSRNYTRRRLHQSRLAWVTDAIAKYASNPIAERAIEYGPGSGIYLPVLEKFYRDVIGADIELAYLNGIRPIVDAVDNISLIVDNLEDSKFTRDSFNFVLCSEVLEHVPDPEAAVRTLFRILKPGGYAVITTPQRNSLMELCCRVAFLPGIIQLVRAIYREPILETGHISLRSYGELNSSMIASGFEIVECKKFGLYIPILAEFGGSWGGKIIEKIEDRLRNTQFNWMLWTQAYVLRKPI